MANPGKPAHRASTSRKAGRGTKTARKPTHDEARSREPDHEETSARTKAPGGASLQPRLLARLRSVEGHLRGVSQMVEAGAYCIDVLQQTKAIHAALAKVEGILLDRHLHHCVSRAVRSDVAAERERVIAELLDVFEAGRRG